MFLIEKSTQQQLPKPRDGPVRETHESDNCRTMSRIFVFVHKITIVEAFFIGRQLTDFFFSHVQQIVRSKSTAAPSCD